MDLGNVIQQRIRKKNEVRKNRLIKGISTQLTQFFKRNLRIGNPGKVCEPIQKKVNLCRTEKIMRWQAKSRVTNHIGQLLKSSGSESKPNKTQIRIMRQR